MLELMYSKEVYAKKKLGEEFSIYEKEASEFPQLA